MSLSLEKGVEASLCLQSVFLLFVFSFLSFRICTLIYLHAYIFACFSTWHTLSPGAPLPRPAQTPHRPNTTHFCSTLALNEPQDRETQREREATEAGRQCGELVSKANSNFRTEIIISLILAALQCLHNHQGEY